MMTALPDLGPEAKTSGEGPREQRKLRLHYQKHPGTIGVPGITSQSGRLWCNMSVISPRRSWAENQMGNPE